MDNLPFVFSSLPKWRLLRHLVFWLSWFIFQAVLYSFSPSPVLQNQNFLVRLSMTAPESLVYLIPHLFFAYTMMYIVITRFVIRGKYIKALLLTILTGIITATLSAILSLTIIEYLRQGQPLPPGTKPGERLQLYEHLGIAMLAGLRGSITIGGLAASIKLMKCFYEKEQTALTLEREKAITELQMLKAQLHPHFLFNTLNNIYSYTQEVSIVASQMIHGLSELLRYMLYECNQPLVPLSKELKMIKDYIALEKVRYDDHLDLSLNIPAVKDHIYIAPLLLLPLVENCFKHGASKMVRDPWISIDVNLVGNMLTMKLVNGKETGAHETCAGIGTANTRKRLDIIYTGKYEFETHDEEEMYIVNLKLWLQEESAVTVNHPKVQTDETRKDIQLSDS